MSSHDTQTAVLEALFNDESFVENDWQLIEDNSSVLTFDVLVDKTKEDDNLDLDATETIAGFGVDMVVVAKVNAGLDIKRFENAAVKNKDSTQWFKVIKVDLIATGYFRLALKSDVFNQRR